MTKRQTRALENAASRRDSSKSIRWEAHTCLPLHPDASFEPLDRLHAAGVDYACVNVGMDMNPLSQVMSVIAGYRATIEADPDKYVLVRTLDDVDHGHATGRLAIGFDLEGSMPLLDQPGMVALYKALGVHQIHLAYNRNNSVAGGCHDAEQGLTPLGHEMVVAINSAGMLMDCSHTGRRCSLEIMAASKDPVIFSHANVLGLVEHGRNISDEQIKACAATGGVVCVSGVSAFLGVPEPDAAAIARHVAYISSLVGVAHAGIGMDYSMPQAGLDTRPPGDFDPTYWWPRSAGYMRDASNKSSSRFAPPETWSRLHAALTQHGMSEAEVAMVMGGNMWRVASQVWR
jgi:membrane dipeptidase